jgi:filamentous hemagglutinin family protein
VVRQTTPRAVIDWRGFDVGRGHAVEFDQPGAGAMTLNRVTTGGASRIEGAIRAPGTVIIQNQAGVLFTKDARIDVGGLVATSGRVDAARFQAGAGIRIEGGGAPGARVVNEGAITIGEAGLGALVGRDVENAGSIVAQRGTVALASGTATTIDLAGDGMVRLAVTGHDPGGRVASTGAIDVGEGRVVMSAGAAAGALDAVINTGGLVRAGGAAGDGGSIELTGGGGTVRIGGGLDVAGRRDGGAVTATAARVALAPGARIDARGGRDGGHVRIGGDTRGTGPLPRADHVAMARGAAILADGAARRGGRVVLWADDATTVEGRIAATGRVAGGFIETSARERLAIGAGAAVEAGAGGHWLLDPRQVVIGVPGARPCPRRASPRRRTSRAPSSSARRRWRRRCRAAAT